MPTVFLAARSSETMHVSSRVVVGFVVVVVGLWGSGDGVVVWVGGVVKAKERREGWLLDFLVIAMFDVCLFVCSWYWFGDVVDEVGRWKGCKRCERRYNTENAMDIQVKGKLEGSDESCGEANRRAMRSRFL